MALLMKKNKKNIHSIYLPYFYTRGAIDIEASQSIKTDIKTEFYDCRTTSQKYLGSLRLMDFVSQAFSKKTKPLFDYIHKYIEVINEEQNGNLNRLVLLPRQNSPAKTSPHHHTIS